jgi:hypothetical protein
MGLFPSASQVMRTVLGGVGWGGVRWGGQIVRYYRFLVLKKSRMRILFSADSLFVVGGTTLGWGAGPLKLGGKMCSNVPVGGMH